MTAAGAPDVLDLWDRCVREHALQPALVTPSHVWTYRSVDRLTDAWAGSLAARGAGPGRLVGLAFPDPGRTVLGMVAALKAGAGFTVLDDRLPDTARELLVRRTRAAVWLGDGAHAPVTAYVPAGAPGAGGETADHGGSAPDTGGPAGADGLASRRPVRACGGDVAYVLFTSGSTGQPKGTVVERDSLRGFAVAVAERLELTAGDRWLQVASPGFDVLIEEVFPALLSGAAVVCRADTQALDAEELHTMTARTGTTVVELSTQYWLEYARWLDTRGLTTPRELRLVVVGGERMDPGPYREWQARHPARLAHVYGLTECTVSSTFYTGLLPADAEEVPLGTPLRDVEIGVRRDGRPVPRGEAGEIHIGGPLLARGFLDDEAATARRFVPDPLSPVPGARVYRTGDLGRIDADGHLVFLGRLDDQVKIRGHRLEPARVERALCADPAVDQAVVFPDPRTGTALWAFTVPADPLRAPLPGEAVRVAGAEKDALLAPLAAHMPDWAVPRVLYRVSALPKNRHGKIDKRRLSGWAAAEHVAARQRPEAVEAPRAPLATPGTQAPGPGSGPEPRDEPLSTVTDLFREVLDAPGIGPDDDFFDHGGQSLLAMRLLARLRESFPAAAGLRASALLRCPTPRLLAGALRADEAARL
ncbi:amino acid adenylation domain-containing protein [Streptomyces sp. WP-1]|uniref:amino acid adenylation domain-containing protein n=1 Tax=Streptomyces sp. WP-1 TaxID=3041497 RepID=UPI00264A4358|nr:amino acid adenylation domain-containing protein [Streptomyces sp. WP-1]WKE68523.1 amino acid adenylation domain-containing protein [Streptomyces sp. WP-1]